MTSDRHDPPRDLLPDVQRHFDGELGVEQSRRLRQELPRSTEATALHLALGAAESERADAAASRHARMEAAIFGAVAAARGDAGQGTVLSPPRAQRAEHDADAPSQRRWPRSRWRRLRLSRVLVAVAALVAVGLAVIIGTRSMRAPVQAPTGMRSKPAGLSPAADRSVRVAIYRKVDGAVVAVKQQIAGDSALAFAYDNEGERRFDRLLLFALDAELTVYWFYPAHTDPRASPEAVPVRRGRGIELRDAVRHRFAAGPLRVFAVFTRRRDLDVARVEALARQLRRKGRALESIERLPLAETGQHVVPLEVR